MLLLRKELLLLLLLRSPFRLLLCQELLLLRLLLSRPFRLLLRQLLLGQQLRLLLSLQLCLLLGLELCRLLGLPVRLLLHPAVLHRLLLHLSIWIERCELGLKCRVLPQGGIDEGEGARRRGGRPLMLDVVKQGAWAITEPFQAGGFLFFGELDGFEDIPLLSCHAILPFGILQGHL